MSRRWLLRAGVFIGLIAAILIFTVIVQKKGENAPAVAAASSPEFVLRDQQNRLTSLAQFRGKVVVLIFIDPECTQICPLTTRAWRKRLRSSARR